MADIPGITSTKWRDMTEEQRYRLLERKRELVWCRAFLHTRALRRSKVPHCEEQTTADPARRAPADLLAKPPESFVEGVPSIGWLCASCKDPLKATKQTRAARRRQEKEQTRKRAPKRRAR
jgi:hypothetical protein